MHPTPRHSRIFWTGYGRGAGNANRSAARRNMYPFAEKTEEEKVIDVLAHELELVYGWLEAAEHRVQLTAFGVGMLAFFAGFGICWFAFVR